MKNILVIQPLPGIGDVFWFDAVLQSLYAFYREPLTLMTKRRSQAQHIYEHSVYVQDVLWVERPGIHDGLFGFVRLVCALKQKKITDAWIFHKSWRYSLACKLAGIANVIFYPSKKEWLAQPPIKRAERLLQMNNIPLLEHPKFHLSHKAQQSMTNKMRPY